LTVEENELVLQVTVTALRDEAGEVIGSVIVFDDLTQLQKAQRMAAWREVAKRIAHEIKNPLTPIQLSAQRLRRRYLERLGPEETVFDECTAMIIKQVDELKKLVNEFSSFARMPTINPALHDLNTLIEQTLVLFRQGHREIEFIFTPDPTLPEVSLDAEQITRVLINLIDNGIAASAGQGRIEIETGLDRTLGMVSFTVSDQGCGIPGEDKLRLFEPYFSTKKSGTGLGLAIVATIVADHHGYIRVRDNQPRGSRFIVELPIKAPDLS
jgi:two-component system nitrogen regulation sensor histidine kinase NtrY